VVPSEEGSYKSSFSNCYVPPRIIMDYAILCLLYEPSSLVLKAGSAVGDRRFRARFPAGDGNFCLCERIPSIVDFTLPSGYQGLFPWR
jgi:hypothetical protein